MHLLELTDQYYTCYMGGIAVIGTSKFSDIVNDKIIDENQRIFNFLVVDIQRKSYYCTFNANTGKMIINHAHFYDYESDKEISCLKMLPVSMRKDLQYKSINVFSIVEKLLKEFNIFYDISELKLSKNFSNDIVLKLFKNNVNKLNLYNSLCYEYLNNLGRLYDINNFLDNIIIKINELKYLINKESEIVELCTNFRTIKACNYLNIKPTISYSEIKSFKTMFNKIDKNFLNKYDSETYITNFCDLFNTFKVNNTNKEVKTFTVKGVKLSYSEGIFSLNIPIIHNYLAEHDKYRFYWNWLNYFDKQNELVSFINECKLVSL